jgi:hypothetical protein
MPGNVGQNVAGDDFGDRHRAARDARHPEVYAEPNAPQRFGG